PHQFNSALYEGNGYFLVSSPQHPEPQPARCYYVSDDQVAAAARPCQEPGLRPRLDERSKRAAGIMPVRGHDEGEDEGAELGPRERLLAALTRAPRDGISPDELVTETGMSRAWVNHELQLLVRTGGATRLGRGRYRPADEGGPPDR